ncbi:hypothetical protein E2C01_065413 [Portunus trituberculatus]|uniref:Uncharacterized protein n=1 Tax=Portunus trituberculatus TaxID=210409 RepID=A0A5B7HLU5_PORTR|nr:hypothetical protein [Portunus trituberculatus]
MEIESKDRLGHRMSPETVHLFRTRASPDALLFLPLPPSCPPSTPPRFPPPGTLNFLLPVF